MMDKFCYDNFYLIQSLVGLTVISIDVAFAMIEVERMKKSSKALKKALYDCALFLKDWQKEERDRRRIKSFAEKRFGNFIRRWRSCSRKVMQRC